MHLTLIYIKQNNLEMLFHKILIAIVLVQSFHVEVVSSAVGSQANVTSSKQQQNNSDDKNRTLNSDQRVSSNDIRNKNSTSSKVLRYCQALKKPKFVPGSGSLLTYLLRLQLCKISENRTWFDDECRNRLFAISEYYKDVYLKFCDPGAFLSLCKSKISTQAVLLHWLKLFDVRYHVNLTGAEHVTRVPIESEPSSASNLHCFSIESFFESALDLEQSTADNSSLELQKPFHSVPYTEWFLTYKPFCHPVGCGISRSNYDNSSISAYDCLPKTCRSSILLTIVVDALLAVIIVFSNVLVLTVAVRSTVMKNIPGFFKISLAVGDLMVGLVVLPGCVYHHYVLSLDPLPYRSEGQRPQATDYFKQSYLNFMGIFTVWSFAVSLYTMGAASVDRYFAITRPFKYKQGKYLTKKRSLVVFICVWLFAFVIALYPVFTTQPYYITGIGLVLSTGLTAIFVYAITLGIPLLAVWVINVAMLGKVCSDRKNRKTLSVSRKKQTMSSLTAKESKKKGVFSVSANDEINDDVFEEENCGNRNMNNNNNKKLLKGNYIYSRGNAKNTTKPQSRFSKLSSTVQKKFRNRSSKSSTKSIASQANVERRLAKTLAVMIGAFTVAILPNVILLAIQPALTIFISPKYFPKTYSEVATNTYITLEYFATRLFLSNSFWNCIIYSVRNQHFRRAAVDVFICDEEKRRRRRNTIANSNSSSSRNQGSQSQTKATTCDSTEV